MRISVLVVPGCPNAPLVVERLRAACPLGVQTSLEVIVVRTDEEAVRWGMTGSPTVLVQGVDPFAVAGAVPGLACRLYRDEDGHVDGAPSVDQLRRALDGAAKTEQDRT